MMTLEGRGCGLPPRMFMVVVMRTGLCSREGGSYK